MCRYIGGQRKSARHCNALRGSIACCLCASLRFADLADSGFSTSPVSFAAAVCCDRDELLADFFTGLLNAGDVINATAARQLIKTKPLIFMTFPPVVISIPQIAAKGIRGAAMGWPLEFGPLARGTSISWLHGIADGS